MTRPPLRTTHTYVILEVTGAAFAEIEDALRGAGYDHVFDEDNEFGVVMDMQGIALGDERQRMRIAAARKPSEPLAPVGSLPEPRGDPAPTDAYLPRDSGVAPAPADDISIVGRKPQQHPALAAIGPATGFVRTLAGEWATFDQTCLSRMAQKVQRRDLQAAFYCGAEAFCRLMGAEAPPGQEDAEFADRQVEGMVEELLRFWAASTGRMPPR